jgi:hypothetical protein
MHTNLALDIAGSKLLHKEVSVLQIHQFALPQTTLIENVEDETLIFIHDRKH